MPETITNIYTPVVDYSNPATRNQWAIEKLKNIGIYNRVNAWATAQDWFRANQLRPVEVRGGKLWSIAIPDTEPGSMFWCVVFGEPVPVDKAGAWMSHSMMEIYSPGAAKLYRDYAPLFREWGGIPALRWQQVHEATARSLNTVEEPQAYGNPPLAVWGPGSAPPLGMTGGVPFPSDCALRRNPETAQVELFKIQDFVKVYGNPVQYWGREAAVGGPVAVKPHTTTDAGFQVGVDITQAAAATGPLMLGDGIYLDQSGRVHTSILVDEARHWMETPFELRVLSGKFGDGTGTWERVAPSPSTNEYIRGMFDVVRPGCRISDGGDKGAFTYLEWKTATGKQVKSAVSILVRELCGVVVNNGTLHKPDFAFNWAKWRLEEMAQKAEF